MIKVAILALQGAFAEHQQMLHSIGIDSVLIRNLQDWEMFISSSSGNIECDLGLVIPGGESTAMMKIMKDENLVEPIRSAIIGGMPTFGTCAGMILLDDKHLGCMDITVKRNAYGRQLGSFHTEHDFKGIGFVPMTFIRAPYIERCGKDVEVLSVLDGNIIAARSNNIVACSFHPELTTDTRVHQFVFGL